MLPQSGDRPAGKAVPHIAGIFPQSLPENLLRVGIHGSGTPGAGFRDQAVESEAEVILDPAHGGSRSRAISPVVFPSALQRTALQRSRIFGLSLDLTAWVICRSCLAESAGTKMVGAGMVLILKVDGYLIHRTTPAVYCN